MDDQEMERMARAFARATMDEAHRLEELSRVTDPHPRVVYRPLPRWVRLIYAYDHLLYRTLETLALIAIAMRLWWR